jgi:cysteinyl-tRNA synthetase
MTLRDALQEYSPEALRFYFLSGHYRSPLDFSEDQLKSAEAATQRLGEFWRKLQSIKNKTDNNEKVEKRIDSSWKTFDDAMNDDFNTPEAISVIFELAKNLNPELDRGNINQYYATEIIEFLDMVNGALGIIPTAQEAIPHEIQNVVKIREELREKKKFEEADKIRKHIEEVGYQIDDTPYGPLIKRLK